MAFLSRLCGGTTLYVINDAALDYMKDRQLPQVAIGKFADHKERIFSRPEDWERHLQALDLTDLDVTPDPVLIASEPACLAFGSECEAASPHARRTRGGGPRLKLRASPHARRTRGDLPS